METEGWREEEEGRRREREREAKTGQNVVYTSLLRSTDFIPHEYTIFDDMSVCLTVCLSACLSRFFIDTQPSPDFVVSAEEQRKINQRAHRFTSGAEGNRAIKKLSINDLIRPAVSGSGP